MTKASPVAWLTQYQQQ